MGIKAVSGVLRPRSNKRTGGSATISFSSGNVTSTSQATFVDRAKWGSGSFRSQPCKAVSLRRVEFQDLDKSSAFHTHTHTDKVNINDSFVKQGSVYTGLRIEWSASDKNSAIREISVFVMGETDG